MALSANKLNLMKQRDFIPVSAFNGFLHAFVVESDGSIGTNMEVGLSANTDAATFEGGTGITAQRNLTATSPVKQASAGAGNPYMTEIGSLGLAGMLMAAAADDVRHTMIVPSHWNRHHDIGVRVIWSSEAAAVGDRDVTWKFLYLELTPGTTALAAPATALDTVITAQAPAGTAKVIERGNQGIIAANSIADAALYWSFLVEMDAIDAAFTENVYLLGVEFEYVPVLTPGSDRIKPRSWQA